MQARRQVLGPQPFADGGKDELVQPVAVAKSRFGFRRVDIHVHLVRRQFEKQEGHRVPACHQQSTVCFLECVSQAAVADPAAIDEEVLHPGMSALTRRIGDVAGQSYRSLLRLNGVEPVAHLGAEKKADPVKHAGRGGHFVDELAVVAHGPMDGQVRQGESAKGLTDVAHLGRRGAEELAPHGRVVEEMAHLESCPRAAIPGPDR
jgi:hypothetical protein